MSKKDYDFCGWATRNDVKCSDGRTIRAGAFKECDGLTVPLVWNHDHQDPTNVLGHALLENRPEGVYTYGWFNDTEAGRDAKELVRHRDIRGLSIFANKLKQNGGDVLHGMIREVSLVLAGANPGAYIESVLEHGEESADSAIIFWISDEEIQLEHSEKSDEANLEHSNKSEETTKEEAKEMATNEKPEKNGKTVQEVFDTLNDEQKELLYALVGKAVEDAVGGDDEDDEELDHSDNDEGEDSMYSVFEDNGASDTLSHAEQMSIFSDAIALAKSKSCKLSDAFNAIVNEKLGDELAHSIDNIELLFPDFTELNRTPKFIRDPDDWVSKVMNGVRHTPYAKIKTTFADITEGEARARGYVTGTRKLEEVFHLLRRTTQPTTVYKLQKIDRDTVVDITSFDVVAWMKGEQRQKLDEELARAFLIGDGRLAAAQDKIDETCIRPIWTDDDLFTIKKLISVPQGATEDQIAKAIIRGEIKAMNDYRGSATPTLFISREYLTLMLLMEDSTGRVIYDSVEKLKNALQVKEIVTVPAFKNRQRTADGNTYKLIGLVVNLGDYNVGADKGGEVNFFEDFVLDFNKYEYLVETRCSGALVEPYSAIALELMYGLLLSVVPASGATTYQSDVIVHDDWIGGTLKYQSSAIGTTAHHALEITVTATDGATVTVVITGRDAISPTEVSGSTYLIPIDDPRKQKLTVTVTKSGESVSSEFSLSSLRLEKASS